MIKQIALVASLLSLSIFPSLPVKAGEAFVASCYVSYKGKSSTQPCIVQGQDFSAYQNMVKQINLQLLNSNETIEILKDTADNLYISIFGIDEKILAYPYISDNESYCFESAGKTTTVCYK